MDIVEIVEKEVKKCIEEHMNNSEDHYDFWNEHIKYVYEEAITLARIYNADEEIVRLGALLHDIALIRCVGTRAEHHINGKVIAEEILTKCGYQTDKMQRVLGCVYNHRSSKNATNIEEICVADADVLAHFDNIPLLFHLAFVKNNVLLKDVKVWMKEYFEKDYNDLSEKTRESFKPKFDAICKLILGEK